MSATGLLIVHSADLNLDTSRGRKYAQVAGGVVILLQVDVEYTVTQPLTPLL